MNDKPIHRSWSRLIDEAGGKVIIATDVFVHTDISKLAKRIFLSFIGYQKDTNCILMYTLLSIRQTQISCMSNNLLKLIL